MAIHLPAYRQQAICRYYGEAGERWVKAFPDLLDRCAARWSLSFTGVAEEGYPTNLVVFARQHKQPVVLKLGYPDPDLENLTGMLALTAFAGRGAVALLAADVASGACLLEHLRPGTSFRACRPLSDRSASRLSLFAELPVPDWRGLAGAVADPALLELTLPRFGEWLDRAFDEYRASAEPEFAHLDNIRVAESAYARLLARYPGDCLLHGDLHHENILLDDKRGWLAIDPKGVLGPAVMECARYLQNFIEDEISGTPLSAHSSEVSRIMMTRVDEFARLLGYPAEDIMGAALVDLVVSTTWTLNNDDDGSVGAFKIDVMRELLEQ